MCCGVGAKSSHRSRTSAAGIEHAEAGEKFHLQCSRAAVTLAAHGLDVGLHLCVPSFGMFHSLVQAPFEALQVGTLALAFENHGSRVLSRGTSGVAPCLCLPHGSLGRLDPGLFVLAGLFHGSPCRD